MVDCPKCSKRLLPHGQGKDTSLLCNACGIHHDLSLKEKSSDRAFHTGWSLMKNGEGMVTITMPNWAHDTIMETLAMDLESSMIDPEIRAKLGRAMETMRVETEQQYDPTEPEFRMEEGNGFSFREDME